jgi:hypothetical protein
MGDPERPLPHPPPAGACSDPNGEQSGDHKEHEQPMQNKNQIGKTRHRAS